ncbi:MAG TPA: SDR family oxidoreductase [Chitinophagaceae bacterium]|nr:SDR family oxidoreductase [Chitinophagaceae bacterium]
MKYQPGETIKQLLVFGATGRTGKIVVELALNAGYAVIAVARNPAAASITHPRLTVVKGNVLNPADFETFMQQTDAVISCLGSNGTKPTYVFSHGIQNIIAAMNKAGIKRVMCMSASALVISPKLPAFYRFVARYVVQKILKNPYSDLELMEKILEYSGTDWTIVRPPQLTNKPAKGNYRFAANSFLDNCLRITRADLARFMVDNIANQNTYKAIVEVAN